MHLYECRWAVLAAGSTLVTAACVNRVEQAPVPPRAAAPAEPAVASALVVEQFLRAVNTNDVDTMARLFGTKQGPIAGLYDREQVDGRMLALAHLLKHEDYAIKAAAPMQGRQGEARRLIVRMRVRGWEADVPYTLVRSDVGHWLIEQIELERVTGR